MSEIINLNKARKVRAKAEATRMAAANRVLHGRSRTEREAASLERERANRLLDGAKREDPAD